MLVSSNGIGENSGLWGQKSPPWCDASTKKGLTRVSRVALHNGLESNGAHNLIEIYYSSTMKCRCDWKISVVREERERNYLQDGKLSTRSMW